MTENRSFLQWMLVIMVWVMVFFGISSLFILSKAFSAAPVNVGAYCRSAYLICSCTVGGRTTRAPTKNIVHNGKQVTNTQMTNCNNYCDNNYYAEGQLECTFPGK